MADEQHNKALDERDLAMVQRQARALEEKINARMDGDLAWNKLTWEAYKREAELHAINHHNEHVRDSEARALALAGMDKRLEGMNEFRSQLKDQASTFARSETVDQRFTALTDRIVGVEKALVLIAGKSGGTATAIAYIVTGISVAGMLIAIFFALAGR